MNVPSLGTTTSLTVSLKRTVVRTGVLSAGRGQPVVMLHAALSSKLQWAALSDRIAPKFQAVAVDLHGYGDNPPPANRETYSIEDEVDLVRSRIDAVVRRGEPVHLVGHSFGALVALRFAQRFPGAVQSLALYEPVMLGLLGRNDLAAGAIRQIGATLVDLVRKDRGVEAAELAVDFWNTPGSFASLPAAAKASAIASTPQAALDFDRIMNRTMAIEGFRSLRIASLLIGGTRSPAGARNSVDLLARTLPLSRVAWLDANHMAPIVSPQLVNPLVEEFLASQAARREPLRRAA